DLATMIEIAEAAELGLQVTYGISNERNRQEENNTQIRKNTFMREKDVKRNEMDDLTEMMKRMEIKMANIEQRKINRNGGNNGRECFNCGRPGHIARNCRIQENIRQDTRNNTCHECGKLGHKARE